MVRGIFIEGTSFELNDKGIDKRAIKDTLTTPAQIIHLLICYNLKPCSHVHTAPMDCTTLLWYILVGLQVDIAWIIANEMRSIVESGIKNCYCSPLPWLDHGTMCCNTCSHTYETITGPVNDAYINRYYKKKAVQQQQPQAAPLHPTEPQPPAAPLHPTEPQQAFPEIDPRLQN
ncbi:hypothetical protein TSUD_16260 [Trifolium subterraneum]|uniref:Uncharacterized protein n=1 Tax=Trifolium subterraneum TaxID=3900 RepID=A0A2Z6MNY1_TRISU|nr:hypothetical protein TSUD_16260 [Trifolium subterraneum]